MNELIPLKDLKNPLSKKQIEFLGEQTGKSFIEAAKEDPLKARIFIKRVQIFLDSFDKEIQAAALSEAEKYGSETEIDGSKIIIIELGTKYDYLNDSAWLELNKKVSEFDLLRKEREKLLKAIKGSMTEIDEETGEIRKIFPPLKTSTIGIKITI